jgi:hypothetical protein
MKARGKSVENNTGHLRSLRGQIQKEFQSPARIIKKVVECQEKQG